MRSVFLSTALFGIIFFVIQSPASVVQNPAMVDFAGQVWAIGEKAPMAEQPQIVVVYGPRNSKKIEFAKAALAFAKSIGKDKVWVQMDGTWTFELGELNQWIRTEHMVDQVKRFSIKLADGVINRRYSLLTFQPKESWHADIFRTMIYEFRAFRGPISAKQQPAMRQILVVAVDTDGSTAAPNYIDRVLSDLERYNLKVASFVSFDQRPYASRRACELGFSSLNAD